MFIRQLILKNIGKGYMLNTMKKQQMDPQLFLDQKMNYMKKLKHYPDLQFFDSQYRSRLTYRLSPGQQRKKDKSNEDRLHNRRQVDFLCRYVLASRKKEIPLH